MQLSSMVVFAMSIASIQAAPAPEQIDYTAQSLDRRQNYFDTELTCNGELSPVVGHYATKSTCQVMIDSLMDNEVRTQPRDHCYTVPSGETAGSRCCVSWGKEVPRGTTYTELKSVAQDILDQCSAANAAENYVSGKQTQANLGGQCTSVCLSSRPEGCEQASGC